MACPEVRFTCAWVSAVLIDLIKMHVRWPNKLDSDAHGYCQY